MDNNIKLRVTNISSWSCGQGWWPDGWYHPISQRLLTVQFHFNLWLQCTVLATWWSHTDKQNETKYKIDWVYFAVCFLLVNCAVIFNQSSNLSSSIEFWLEPNKFADWIYSIIDMHWRYSMHNAEDHRHISSDLGSIESQCTQKTNLINGAHCEP